MSDTAIDTDEFLAHFGIKGMKWGVRHVVGPNGRVTGLRSTHIGEPSHDYEQAQAIKKKHMSEMSNEELRKLTTRMNLEQQYSRLNPSTIQRGKSVALGIIAVGTTYATVYNMVVKKNAPLRQTYEWGKKIVKTSLATKSKL